MDNGAEHNPSGTGPPATRGDRLRQRITLPWRSRLNPLTSNPSYTSVDLTDLSQIRSQKSDSKSSPYPIVDSKNTGFSTISAPDAVDPNDSSIFVPPKVFHKNTHFLAINFGKWRVFVRQTFVFGALVIFIYIPSVRKTRRSVLCSEHRHVLHDDSAIYIGIR